jgi:oxygen-dependent protoporphyrinogen oxidase
VGDTEPQDDLDALAAAARSRRVVVIGGGIAGIVAALECAQVGLQVTLLEASDRLGGAIRTIRVDGLDLDAAVEGWSARNGAVRALATGLGLEDAIAPAADSSAWIAGLPGIGAAPLPAHTIAGVPENPWDESVRRVIGWSGTWRAYLDRMRPPLTIGKERSLGRLVRSRMGDAVVDRLVAPVSLGVYGTHPDGIDVEIVAPGLSTALTRTGSLSGAVADLRVGGAAGPVLEGLEGGMSRLLDAARARLAELGADVRLRSQAIGLERHEDGVWSIASASASDPDAEADGEPVLAADFVILAVPEPEARRLCAPVVPALDAPVGGPQAVEVVTLVVHEPALDGAPRGSAVYPVPGTHRAVGLTHSTVRWPWLAAAAGPGIHVLRVAFGTAADAPATAALDDAAAFELARTEASALLGVELRDVRGAARAAFDPARPGSALGQAAAAAAARGAIRNQGGLAAVGGWLAGSGLAQVVADAVAETERVRRQALFGSAST